MLGGEARRFGSFCKMGVRFLGILMVKALFWGVYKGAPDFWKLPFGHWTQNALETAYHYGAPTALQGSERGLSAGHGLF